MNICSETWGHHHIAKKAVRVSETMGHVFFLLLHCFKLYCVCEYVCMCMHEHVLVCVYPGMCVEGREQL